jgi:O-antigen/teichoic acid export membrane protein
MQEGSQRATGMGSITKRLLLSSGKVAIYQGLGLLLGFCYQAFISRTCGASGLGGLTIFVSWLGILSVFTVPGLDGTLVYFLPRYENDVYSRRKVVRVCLFIVGTISLLFMGGIFATGDGVFIWIGLPSNARTAFAFSVFAFSFGKLLDAVFLGMNDAPLIGYFNNIRTVLRFIFCLPIFFYPQASWMILFYAIAIEEFMTDYLRYGSIRKRYPQLLRFTKGSRNKVSLKSNQVIATSLPMFGIGIIDTFSPLLDKAILGMMVSLELVGVYKVSDSIATLVSVFVSPFIAFWPYISKLFNENRLQELRDTYQTINLIIISLMIPFVLALVELSGFSLSLFGQTFALNGKTILLILAFGTAVDAIAGPAGAVLKMTNHSRLSFLINIVLLVIYVGLSIVLTRHYGVIGAAIAKTFVIVLGNITNMIANHLLIGIFPYKSTHAWLLGCGVSILAVRSLFPDSGLGVGGHFCLAIGEVTLFICFAMLILQSQIKHIREQIGVLRPVK